jgi:hypothetical protein
VPPGGSLAVGLAALALYLALAPSVSGDQDSAEFTLVLAFNGVAHPTGYPLYTLFGHLWARLVHPLGATWAYAANSWSALGGGVAVYLLHRLGCALIPASAPLGRRQRSLLALLPTAYLALNPIWTYGTTLAEVYSWHVAWGLGACLQFARLVGRLAGPDAIPPRRLRLHAAGWGLMCGLGGAHHATSLFVVAPLSVVLIVVLARARRLTPALPIVALAAALVPLGSYGVIYWRATHPAPVQWPALVPGLDGLLTHVTGQQYRRNLGRFAPSPEQARLLAWYVWPFLGPGLALLVAGALRARGLAPRAVGWGLAIVAVGGAVYAFNYGVVDPSSYFLLPLALGLAGTIPIAAHLLGHPARRRAAWAGVAALSVTALGLWVPWTRTNVERISLYLSFDRYLGSMWESIPLDTAFVFWASDMTYRLRERQLLAGEKPGLLVYHPLFILNDAPRARFIARHGIDPAAALASADREALALRMTVPDSLLYGVIASVERHVNAVSPIPVVHFDPERSTVRLLRKPGDAGAPPESLARGASAPGSAPKAGDHPR